MNEYTNTTKGNKTYFFKENFKILFKNLIF